MSRHPLTRYFAAGLIAAFAAVSFADSADAAPKKRKAKRKAYTRTIIVREPVVQTRYIYRDRPVYYRSYRTQPRYYYDEPSYDYGSPSYIYRDPPPVYVPPRPTYVPPPQVYVPPAPRPTYVPPTPPPGYPPPQVQRPRMPFGQNAPAEP